MIIEVLPVGMLQANCYIAGCSETREAAVIDPGGDPQIILDALAGHDLTLRYVLNTHGHFDHTDANGALVEATGAQLAAHALDKPLLAAAGGAAIFGLQAKAGPAPDLELADGDELAVGRLCLRVLHTPGHTPGHVCFYEAGEGVLFDGDVLFRRGIGRSDLPGGDPRQLMASIQKVLFALPDMTVVYSGHGPPTTIGEEKKLNPWVGGYRA
ncbi:MAG: MBL fold metallo-hydrolase [Anaerolineae bacterium]